MWIKNSSLLLVVLLTCNIETIDAECNGKTAIISGSNGTIILGQNTTYPENTHCEWLITASLPGQYIKLIFRKFDTECAFDFLKIYDGPTTSAKLLGTFSGNTLPANLLSSTSSVLLNFFSDNNYSRTGWVIDFMISNCPGSCSDHGTCIGHNCTCDELYTGEACDVELCPEMCNNRSGNGDCSKLDGKCICNGEYAGQSCSYSAQSAAVGTWNMIKERSTIFKARFGHAGVYVKEDNAFWIFGGTDLNGFFDDLLKFDFKTNEWSFVTPLGPSPSARYRHTLVNYKDTLILFGGELLNGTLINELWSFNMSTMNWLLLPAGGSGSPPGLASHTANVVDDGLFIFGGRSMEHGISYEMYKYNLRLMNQWEKVVYKLYKNSDICLAGHTSVYYPALESLVIFGGLKHLSGRTSEKQNSVFLFHVKRHVWMKVKALSRNTSYVPEPRAFHTSVAIGEYMVVYGGNVHKHSSNEKCFASNIYLFNLKTFSWVSPSLLSALGPSDSSLRKPKRGRLLSVAAVFNNNTLLLSGGYNGIANGDLLAYQFPSNIASGSLKVITALGTHCDHYNENDCGLDPSCIWCPATPACLSVINKSSCTVKITSSTPRLCGLFHQCSSCLTWGTLPHLVCGWCVQDSRCYAQDSPSGACSPKTEDNVYNLRGWWGDAGSFLKSIVECRSKNNPPGLLSNVSFIKYHKTYTDVVSVVNPMRVQLHTKPELRRISGPYEVSFKLIGFIYPFLILPINTHVKLQLGITTGSASVRLSINEDRSDIRDKVISVKNKDGSSQTISDIANTTGTLFPNAALNKRYYIEINVAPTGNGVMSLFMNDELINGSFLRPFFSNNCSVYGDCLSCLTDSSCGWCSSTNKCILRNSSFVCSHSSGETLHLILNTTFCETCTQHVECDTCLNDKNCAWHYILNYCESLDFVTKTDQAKRCPSCYSLTDCHSCVHNTNCLWCGVTQKCIPWFSYLADSLHGSCSHWTDWFTRRGKCPGCSQHLQCSDCYKERSCGWCGEYHDGTCFRGGFEGPTDGQCQQLMHSSNPNTNSSLWSYTTCPDENECITKKDCHINATCTDYVGGYDCKCRIGFVGDGYHCNVSCNPPCMHGTCNSGLTCDCDLGWTGNVCSIDCGCNNHSTCYLAVGKCDKCQEFTYGEHCEFCVRGSYGNATSSIGCNKCFCNGHGDERRGVCDIKTGECYCMKNTKGKQCDECLQPGLVGYPRRGGGCYYPCKAHSVLSNVTEGAISSSNGTMAGNKADTSCVWIITAAKNESQYIVYGNEKPYGTITFRLKDIQVDCQTDHVYLYDGFPPYNLEDFNTASFKPIGSLCGFNAVNILSVETKTGTLVVVFKSNASRSFSSGFNGTFTVNRCPDSCTGNHYCYNNGSYEKCVCKDGWTGSGCDQIICPANCSQRLGHGYCHQDNGLCICAQGFAGKSCEIGDVHDNQFIWETISNINGRTSRLHRMAHTMVADNISKCLIIYGGYSFPYGIIGDIWIYDTVHKSFTRLSFSGVAPRPRYLHAAAVDNRHMYISGGITENGFSEELWKFDLDAKQWSVAQSVPRRLAGHTLNVIDDTMYLIGGYDPKDYCSSKVYFLKLHSNSAWDVLKPTGDIFQPCFGHTTVYDKQSHSLIVFGKEAAKLSATAAILSLNENKWTVMPKLQPFSRSFHLSIMVGNITLVLGGYTGTSVQDFAADLLGYNLKCSQWMTIDTKGQFPKRLAHGSIASIDNEIYVFGGYNGISSDELFRLNISSDWCSIFLTRSSCIDSRSCKWCVNQILNQSFCYSKDSPVTCFNSTSAENDCMMLPKAQSLSNGPIPWFDDCNRYSVAHGCSACIQEKNDNGQSASCFWAIDSHQCLSLYVQPILCPFGICGQMLRDNDICPEKCDRTTYCSDCLQQSNCGWCTDPSENGAGVCLEGTLTGPFNTTCKNRIVGSSITKRFWVSSVCLLENECENGNHLCNENETCLDTRDKYLCECKNGYERSTDSKGKCVPVCSQGCLHGSCIDPNVCDCSFGWVGFNCSVPCQCNGKGNCLNENYLDVCTDCRDNTAGGSCEHCLPNFVGENGYCRPCNEKCNSNGRKCSTLDSTEEAKIYGPKSNEDYVCECENNSKGKQCESCEDGYFKLKRYLKCEKCQCRGHGDTCSPHSGLGCNCNNNTQASLPCLNIGGSNTKNCHTLQCSTCRGSNYFGDPEIEGQQCYRTIRILQQLSMERENSQGSRLSPRQTNFFHVHPSYTNADIRLTLDVFVGSIDVYIAQSSSAFLVQVDQNVSYSSESLSHLDWYTDGLNKYSTYMSDHQAVVITDVNHKLVVTFPCEEHQLEQKRFYIVIKAGQYGARGIIYFKQDTSKIDLVVFFAVFFSCFFLFLSLLAIAWSIRHRINSRQQVHNREVQRERLESRPFAQFPFLFEYQAPSPSAHPHRKTTASSRKAMRAMSVQSTNDSLAAISTVMLQLPQTDKTKMSLVLGTTLTLLSAQQLDRLARPVPKLTDETETEI